MQGLIAEEKDRTNQHELDERLAKPSPKPPLGRGGERVRRVLGRARAVPTAVQGVGRVDHSYFSDASAALASARGHRSRYVMIAARDAGSSGTLDASSAAYSPTASQYSHSARCPATPRRGAVRGAPRPPARPRPRAGACTRGDGRQAWDRRAIWRWSPRRAAP